MSKEKDKESLLLSINGEMLEKLSVEIAEKIKQKKNSLDLNKAIKVLTPKTNQEELETIENNIAELEKEISELKEKEEKILVLRKQNDEYFDSVNAPEAPKPQKHSSKEFENDLKKFGELLDFLKENFLENSSNKINDDTIEKQ